ncbi:MAG: VapC toxin family PIN domain ribonuclease, partial [Rhizobium leguminosarum]|nr:VapC toxin family PIN domain ribonuclease [Rhizobium leguminosarum]
RLSKEDVSQTIHDLLNAGNVAMTRPAVEAGLAMLEADGDFADGAIAHEGAWLRGESFVSFDKQAVELAIRQGQPGRLLA